MAKAETKENTLEQNIEELQKVIKSLEAGELPLDKAFEQYKNGMDLLLKCNNSIEKVEQQLAILESEGM